MILSETCVSDLELDEWFSGELDVDAEANAAAHFATCVRCTARRTALQREREAFLAAAPSFDAHARLIAGERPAPPASRTRVWWIGGSVLGAAAAVLIAVLPVRDRLVERSKGAPHLGFFVKRGAQISRGSSGEAVQPGDLVRFTYSSARERYLALLNLDARRASVYYPAGAMMAGTAPALRGGATTDTAPALRGSATVATRIRAGIDVPLDFSIELDAELGAEHVYAVFCDQPFALDPLRAQLETARGLRAPPGCEIDMVALVKEARR
jgi:hypothetical protein